MTETLLAALDARIHAELGTALRTDRAALLDFPNHSNVGDSAIYLGERAYLDRVGVRVVYSCEYRTYSRIALARSIGKGLILLHGGGNFGDLWPEYQQFRERVVAEFPDNPIIQLPQTLHFGQESSVGRASAVFRAHKSFRLFVRDERSLALARNRLGIDATLCPDLAFALGPMRRVRHAEGPVLWLARSDQEAASGASAEYDRRSIVKTDWLEDGDSLGFRATRKAAHMLSRFGGGAMARAALANSHRRLAQLRVNRGRDVLARGRVVVTDRLHAHILCLLLGIPHCIVDNSYGKLRSFYETWTASSPLAHWSESLDAAFREALRLASAER